MKDRIEGDIGEDGRVLWNPLVLLLRVCVCVCPGAFCSSEGGARLDCEDAGSVSFGGLLLLLFFASLRFILIL